MTRQNEAKKVTPAGRSRSLTARTNMTLGPTYSHVEISSKPYGSTYGILKIDANMTCGSQPSRVTTEEERKEGKQHNYSQQGSVALCEQLFSSL